MSDRSFKANMWLAPKSQGLSERENFLDGTAVRTLPTSSIESLQSTGPIESPRDFIPGNYFVQGWSGDSLISKHALQLKKSLDILWKNAQRQFLDLDSRNRSTKLAVYNEFISFAEFYNYSCHEIDGNSSFWDHVKNQNSPYKNILQEFIKTYSFRSVAVYLFKIRFIISLTEELGVKATDNQILNPTSFFAKTFKFGGQTQLISESLQTNHYSWFRPDFMAKESISKVIEAFKKVTVSEMLKIIAYRPKDKREEDSSQKLVFDETEFSHSLSHKSFGLFVNELLINLPQWLLPEEKYKKNISNNEIPYIINSKFEGDYLKSFALSHWPAQESNLYEGWSEIICPDFIGQNFSTGKYFKFCHQLQFLTFLVDVASSKRLDPVALICGVMKEKHARSMINHAGQMSMFSQCEIKSETVYNRIVLNITDLPKKNPHHYLLNRISSQINSLNEDGILVIFTNQNLFVPSQSEKIEQLFQTLKLESIFNFDELIGKGEIANNIYIFKKRSLASKTPKGNINGDISNFISSKKESCKTFKFEGNLSTFSKFKNFVKELDEFFINKAPNSTPIYQKELSKELSFQFYQDAILEGKLLSSRQTSDKKDQLTHPNFFKNLTKSSVPFDIFFLIESINHNNDDKFGKLADGLLGIKLKVQERFPLILIVNQRDQANIKLEVVSSSALNAKKEQYGTALFQYFGLVPKRNDININVFREFFESDIGHQIIQMSLNGGPTKIKAKLKSLLIPKFFTLTSEIPEHIEKGLNFLKITEEEIESTHPDAMLDSYNSIEHIIYSLGHNYPWRIMGLMSYFKHNLQSSLEKFDGSNSYFDFKNPLIKRPLVALKSHNIYPLHPEVHIEFLISNPEDLKSPCSQTKIETTDKGNKLVIFNEYGPVLEIHSGIELLQFIKFILKNARSISISTILQTLKVPKLGELKEVLSNHGQLKESVNQIYTRSSKLLREILTSQISRH